MMDADKAQAFAREWVKAWNDHDLEAILVALCRGRGVSIPAHPRW
jgi:hypothetical protein